MTEALRPAYDDGALTDDDFVKIAAYLQTFAGGTMSTVTPVVEYYNAGFGHYFTTADADEIAGLDAGAFDFAFVRTGREFNAFVSPVAGTVPVCRFFTTPGTFGSKSSHFYTANAAECAGLKLNPAWVVREDRVLHPRTGERLVRGRHGTGLPDVQQRADRRTEPPVHQRPVDLPGSSRRPDWAPEGIAFCAPP